MTPFGTLLGVELTKVLRRPMTWVLAAILVGFLVLIYGSLTAALLAPPVEGFDPSDLRAQVLLPNGFGFGLSIATGVGTVLVVILAASVYGSEFSWGTVRTMLLARVGRTRLILGKLVLVELAALVVTLLGAVIGIVAPLLIGLVIGESVPAGSWATADFFTDALFDSLRAFVAIGMWTLIGAMVTLLTHSLATGLGITLALYFVGDAVLGLIAQAGDVGTWIARLFPNQAITAILMLNQPTPPAYEASDWVWIVANLVVYAVGLTALGIVRFRRDNVLATSSSA